jgi:hypothetical protein
MQKSRMPEPAMQARKTFEEPSRNLMLGTPVLGTRGTSSKEWWRRTPRDNWSGSATCTFGLRSDSPIVRADLVRSGPLWSSNIPE